MSEPRTVTARWVFPVSGPPLERGTITIRGERIEAVEPHGTRTPDEDLGNVAFIPGLANAHTHLDLSGARGLIPPTDPDHFTDWLRGVIAYRRTRTPEQTQDDIRAGLAECLRAGTTLIGDITAEGQSWDALVEAPTRAVVFDELIGLSQERIEHAAKRVREWYFSRKAIPTCTPGVSPHSPYSVNRDYLTGFERGIISTVHLAESPGELELLASRTGPFVEFLKAVGVWEPGSLIPYLARVLITSRYADHALFVHCNYLPADHCRYIAGLHTIVYCPRTHAAFGHPPHPFREFLARGVRVCLGTDSLASNPDLDIFAEAQFVHERYPDFPGSTLLRMVTLSGAEALGWADEAGSLDPGKSADLVALPLHDRESANPYELLFSSAGERRTMFRGQWH